MKVKLHLESAKIKLDTNIKSGAGERVGGRKECQIISNQPSKFRQCYLIFGSVHGHRLTNV